MSAETLRRAAALMRERAETATPGPWECTGDHLVWPSENGPGANDPILGILSVTHMESAGHIASWHPAVALAVADWLYDAAENQEMQEPGGELHHQWDMRVHVATRCALTVARAYLGEDA